MFNFLTSVKKRNKKLSLNVPNSVKKIFERPLPNGLGFFKLDYTD